MSSLFVRNHGVYIRATELQVHEASEAYISRRFRPGYPILSHPDLVRQYLRARLAHLPQEVVGCLFLNVQHRLLGREDLFQGTIDGASIYPREIVRRTIHHNAGSVILYHNHPSGSSEPSHVDKVATRRIRDALSLIDVRLLDHLIVGEQIFSFSEHGML